MKGRLSATVMSMRLTGLTYLCSSFPSRISSFVHNSDKLDPIIQTTVPGIKLHKVNKGRTITEKNGFAIAKENVVSGVILSVIIYNWKGSVKLFLMSSIIKSQYCLMLTRYVKYSPLMIL